MPVDSCLLMVHLTLASRFEDPSLFSSKASRTGMVYIDYFLSNKQNTIGTTEILLATSAGICTGRNKPSSSCPHVIALATSPVIIQKYLGSRIS